MTPYEFITKWRASTLKESSASQEHFIDLCRLLGEPTPAEADPTGEAYCFERGARKDTGDDGWADVWKRHHFAWEYKGQRVDLDAAFGQLRLYALALEQAQRIPERFTDLADVLFRGMAKGGLVGIEPVDWFNGGLFDDDTALPLEKSDIETVLTASDLDWSEIDPSILGTLFERGLDPNKRAQLGAHYTDRDKIMLIVEPVVIRPWLAEWKAEKVGIASELERAEAAKSPATRTKAAKRGRAAVPDVPQPAAGVHGTRPGLRIGQLSQPRLAGAQGPGAPGAVRG